MKLRRIDSRHDPLGSALDELRERLSPRGGAIVSEQGRRKTMEVFGEPLSPQQVVERICSNVRQRGLEAVLEYSRKLDGAELTSDSLRVSSAELEAAHRQASPEFLASVRRIRENVLEFQRAILHRDIEVRRANGVVLRQRYLPLERVGICVPGGAAAYPSTVLMTAVPALAAGVSEIAIVAPPTPFGANNPDVLATCHEIGVREVFRLGGAQGVAALAYGVRNGQSRIINKVDKIVGPGNMFVALAKQHVFGDVAIDSIAGPSEVVVIADRTAQPSFIAADLLAQAEHSPGASVLVSWEPSVIEETERELKQQLSRLSRSELTSHSLEAYGAMILVKDADEACNVTDLIAPEHLHIATANPESLMERIRNAGAIFLGDYSPVAVGDYAAGPSHVLPTGGTARWSSGLTANDFLRGGSVIAYSREGLHEVAADVRRLADKEGLTAHRASIDVRFPNDKA